ncbi:MAG: protein kinase, partial [Planctomycetaceae bacterium]|nr:protein kinase [Planctomycetaceae bacterium]
MMTTSPCPSREQLREFLQGQPSSDTDLSSHLDECRECSRMADELDADSDSVIAHLRIKLDGYDCEPVDLSGNQLGDYQLIRRIGAGGMGTVYQALHSHLKKFVAIKVLPQGPAVSKGALPRFRLEMEAAARVDHAHVVRAMDAREIDGRHFLVMEHVEGIDLSRLVKSIGPLSVIDACEIVRQAALGIDSIHAVGMVHRDIKPSNLILSTDGIVKVVDLGLAFLQTSEASAIEYDEFLDTDLSPVDNASMSRLTRTGHRLGTAKYVAPEQAQGSTDVDHRADIFSLGCTLFYLLTGDVPYVEPWVHEADGVAKGPSLRKQRKDVPTSLDALVSRMIAPAVDNRCKHAREVADGLESIILAEELPTASLSDEPALAGLAKLSRQVGDRIQADRKRRHRRRSVVAFSGLVLLLAFAAAAMLPAKFKAAVPVEVEPWPEHGEDIRSPISVVTLPMTPEELAGLVSVQFSPDLSRLLTVYSDTARIWDTKTGKQLYDGALPGQEPPTTSHLAYDVAGHRLLDLTTVEQRELNTQLLKEAGASTEPTGSSTAQRPSTAVTKHWESLIANTSNSRYAAKVDANKVLFFDVSKRINKLVDASVSPIRQLELSGDGRIVAIGGEERLALWDFDTQTLVREDNVGALKAASLSHDGSVIARISDVGMLVVHDLTNELIARPFSDAEVDVADFAWNACVLAYGDRSGVVSVWNCDLFEFFTDYNLATADDEVLLSIAFSRDGKELAAASSLGKVYRIRIDLSPIARESTLDTEKTNLELVATLSGHESRVTSVAFSPDGAKLA